MARLTDKQWLQVRVDYEVHGMSYRQLIEKYQTSKAALSRRVVQENWQKGKAEQLINKKTNAIKELRECETLAEPLTEPELIAVEYEVKERLRLERMFTDSATRNQQIADELLNEVRYDDDMKLNTKIGAVEAHSRLTKNNKETILGKNPETAIQINNNAAENSAIDELHRKRLGVM